MTRLLLTAILLFGMVVPGILAEDPVPRLTGVVTDAGRAGDFAVNGVHVLCSTETTMGIAVGAVVHDHVGCDGMQLGQAVQVFGEKDKHAHVVKASSVLLQSHVGERVTGYAIVDKVLPDAGSGTRVVRADGYAIVISQATMLTWKPPLSGLADVQTNVWVRYSGHRRADGAVVAESAVFGPNKAGAREQKIAEKEEFDPAATKEADRQGRLDAHFRGLDPKRIPAWQDQAMQQRVQSLGARLVPAYQRTLPDGSAGKLQFRFQVVDESKLKDALTLLNGIILVPYQVVEQLQNDDQLATVLADNMAGAIEKQDIRAIPMQQAMGTAEIAGDTAGIFVPGVGLAVLAGKSAEAARMLRLTEEQSGRVSLGLLHDAGFDIREAPKTWWRLGTGKGKKLEGDMPRRAAYLYGVLAENWLAPGELLGKGSQAALAGTR